MAGVLPCGGPKKSPRKSSIMQIIFSFCFGPLRFQRGYSEKPENILGLDSFSNKRSIHLAPFTLYLSLY